MLFSFDLGTNRVDVSNCQGAGVVMMSAGADLADFQVTDSDVGFISQSSGSSLALGSTSGRTLEAQFRADRCRCDSFWISGGVQTTVDVDEFEVITNNSAIYTYDGNDQITISNGCQFDKLSIFSGRGSDTVRIGGLGSSDSGVLFQRDLSIETSVHADTVFLQGSASQPLQVGGNLTLETGTHGDDAVIDFVKVLGNVAMKFGYGWDEVEWANSKSFGSWHADMGHGNDALALSDSFFFGATSAHGGQQQDTGADSFCDFATPIQTMSFEIGSFAP